MGSAQAENGFGGPEAACHVPREAVLHLTLVENCRAEDKWVPVGLKVMNVEVRHRRLPLGAPDKAAHRVCSNVAKSLSIKIPGEPQHFCYLKQNRLKKR